jgi:hypothetical protein
MKVHIGPYKDDRLVMVEIDSYDAWNADHTMALVILPVLKEVKKQKCGIPTPFPSEEAWNIALDKMIYSFEAVLNDYNSDKYHLPYKNGEKGKLIVGTMDGGSFDIKMDHYYDHDLHDIEMKKIQSGFSLFGEYYMALWT